MFDKCPSGNRIFRYQKMLKLVLHTNEIDRILKVLEENEDTKDLFNKVRMQAYCISCTETYYCKEVKGLQNDLNISRKQCLGEENYFENEEDGDVEDPDDFYEGEEDEDFEDFEDEEDFDDTEDFEEDFEEDYDEELEGDEGFEDFEENFDEEDVETNKKE